MKNIKSYFFFLTLLSGCDTSFQKTDLEKKVQHELIYLKCETYSPNSTKWSYIFEMYKPLELCESYPCREYGQITMPGPTRTVGQFRSETVLIDKKLPERNSRYWEISSVVTTDSNGERPTEENPNEFYFQWKAAHSSATYISVDRSDLSSKLTNQYGSYGDGNLTSKEYYGQCKVSNKADFIKEYERVYDFRKQKIEESNKAALKARKELKEKIIL